MSTTAAQNLSTAPADARNGGLVVALKERGEVTRAELEALLDATARDLLGVPVREALAMLDRGELDGTLAGSALRSLRWLAAPR